MILFLYLCTSKSSCLDSNNYDVVNCDVILVISLYGVLITFFAYSSTSKSSCFYSDNYGLVKCAVSDYFLIRTANYVLCLSVYRLIIIISRY